MLVVVDSGLNINKTVSKMEEITYNTIDMFALCDYVNEACLKLYNNHLIKYNNPFKINLKDITKEINIEQTVSDVYDYIIQPMLFVDQRYFPNLMLLELCTQIVCEFIELLHALVVKGFNHNESKIYQTSFGYAVYRLSSSSHRCRNYIK